MLALQWEGTYLGLLNDCTPTQSAAPHRGERGLGLEFGWNSAGIRLEFGSPPRRRRRRRRRRRYAAAVIARLQAEGFERPKCGIRLEFGWNSAGIRLEFDWNSTGIRLEFGWNSTGIRGLQTRESMREDEAPKLAARVDRAQLSAPPDRRALSFAVSPCALRSLAERNRGAHFSSTWPSARASVGGHLPGIAQRLHAYTKCRTAPRRERAWVGIRLEFGWNSAGIRRPLPTRC